jgi:hypothetical protein
MLSLKIKAAAFYDSVNSHEVFAAFSLTLMKDK